MNWGGIIGGVVDGLFGIAQQNRAPRQAGRTAFQENYEGLKGRLEGAKAMGIHPALALGSNIGGSGAPSMVGSDFRGSFENMVNESTRQREWKQEQEFRKSQEANNRERQNYEQRLNEAQIQHIGKQNQFLDEQIRASQEQRIREANRNLRSTASGAHDMDSTVSGRGGSARIDNVGKNVVYVPNEVTRSIRGQAQGNNPAYEYIEMDGRRTAVPFGTTQNHEPSELFQTWRDLEAAFRPEGLIGSRWLDAKKAVQQWKRKKPILPSDFSRTPSRRYRRTK